jgi:hypothetical protein
MNFLLLNLNLLFQIKSVTFQNTFFCKFNYYAKNCRKAIFKFFPWSNKNSFFSWHTSFLFKFSSKFFLFSMYLNSIFYLKKSVTNIKIVVNRWNMLHIGLVKAILENCLFHFFANESTLVKNAFFLLVVFHWSSYVLKWLFFVLRARFGFSGDSILEWVMSYRKLSNVF